jgi:hypothetical protein
MHVSKKASRPSHKRRGGQGATAVQYSVAEKNKNGILAEMALLR